jgi:alpha-tubulin suppressor-like RCC1 family protein
MLDVDSSAHGAPFTTRLGLATSVAVATLFAVPIAGCSGAGGGGPAVGSEPTGQIEALLTQIPSAVQCVQLSVSRGGAVTTMSVMTGQSSAAITIGAVPIGTTTVQANAYYIACGSVTPSTTPDWVGSPVTVDVKPGANPQVAITLLPNVNTSVALNFVSPAVALGSGVDHNFALSAAGGIRAWGSNIYGQLGDGTTINRLVPTVISTLSPIASVNGGVQHSCAVTSNGALVCWGANTGGQQGDGTLTNHPTPTTIIASGVKLVSCGDFHTCIAKTDNTVWCTGANGSGQIGNGNTTTVAAFVQVLSSGSGIDRVSAGSGNTCVVLGIGAVYCWGENSSGQVGLGTTGAPVKLATQVSSLSAVAEIDVGQAHSCARELDGTVWCWGMNANGLLGDGTTVDRSSPVQVSGITNAVQLAVGHTFSCARLQDGTVRCWGNGGSGQLGLGASKISLTPTAVKNLSGVLDIVAGEQHACARLDTGMVACWGDNTYGEVGDGTQLTIRWLPTNVNW